MTFSLGKMGGGGDTLSPSVTPYHTEGEQQTRKHRETTMGTFLFLSNPSPFFSSHSFTSLYRYLFTYTHSYNYLLLGFLVFYGLVPSDNLEASHGL